MNRTSSPSDEVERGSATTAADRDRGRQHGRWATGVVSCPKGSHDLVRRARATPAEGRTGPAGSRPPPAAGPSRPRRPAAARVAPRAVGGQVVGHLGNRDRWLGQRQTGRAASVMPLRVWAAGRPLVVLPPRISQVRA
jgi:hypothetical protein